MRKSYYYKNFNFTLRKNSVRLAFRVRSSNLKKHPSKNPSITLRATRLMLILPLPSEILFTDGQSPIANCHSLPIRIKQGFHHDHLHNEENRDPIEI